MTTLTERIASLEADSHADRSTISVPAYRFSATSPSGTSWRLLPRLNGWTRTRTNYGDLRRHWKRWRAKPVCPDRRRAVAGGRSRSARCSDHKQRASDGHQTTQPAFAKSLHNLPPRLVPIAGMPIQRAAYRRLQPSLEPGPSESLLRGILAGWEGYFGTGSYLEAYSVRVVDESLHCAQMIRRLLSAEEVVSPSAAGTASRARPRSCVSSSRVTSACRRKPRVSIQLVERISLGLRP